MASSSALFGPSSDTGGLLRHSRGWCLRAARWITFSCRERSMARPLVAQRGDVLQLALQLAVALHPLRGDAARGPRRAHRASRLLVMAAVAEAAGARVRGHVGEHRVQAALAFPQLQLAQAGRVHEHAALGQHDQLALGGGVAAAGIVLAHLARVLAVPAQQPVDQRRLADAGGSEERDRGAAPPVGSQRLEADALPRADRVHGHAGGERLHRLHLVVDVRARGPTSSAPPPAARRCPTPRPARARCAAG